MNASTTCYQYRLLMARIEDYIRRTMSGGVASLTETEVNELSRLARLAQVYEDSIPLLPFDAPRDLIGTLRFTLHANNLTQRGLARLLHISEGRLSGLLTGKRSVSTALATELTRRLIQIGNGA